MRIYVAITSTYMRDRGVTCVEVRATALHPRLHTEGFPLYVHTGNLHHGFGKYKSGVLNSSHQQNNLYTRGKVQPQSPLHKRDKGTNPNSTTITSTQRGIDTKPNNNLNHLYTRGITQSKERLQLLVISKTTNNS